MSTPIPSTIEHLDFDPDLTEETKPNEKEKKAPTCSIMFPHPQAVTPGESINCGRKAVFIAKWLGPVCGHTADVYLCAPCWNQALDNPAQEWRCCQGPERCQLTARASRNVTSIEKI